MMTADERQVEVDESNPRPNPDLETEIQAEVYKLDQLITEEDMGAMKIRDWHEATKKGEVVQLSMRYVARRLQRVGTGKDAAKMLKVLKYVYTLLTWFVALEPMRSGGRKLPKKEQLKEKVDAPQLVLDSIHAFFCNRRYWNIPIFA